LDGNSLAIAVDTGIGGPESFDDRPEARRPHLHLHLHLRGVAELLALYREAAGD
jgi:hypothetical protein